jgi:hypothetical protein
MYIPGLKYVETEQHKGEEEAGRGFLIGQN